MTQRIPLPAGTRLELKENTVYEISGDPIGFGGSSIIYNASRILSDGTKSGIKYTLKECFPLSSFSDTFYIRNEYGEIVSSDSSERSIINLEAAKKNILGEEKVSQDIYKTAMRMIPIVEKSDVEKITLPGGEPHTIKNAVTIMESLDGKGRSIHDYLLEEGHLSPIVSFQIIQQVLIALKEIHTADKPYVHLDIQDANIFLHGTLGDESELVTLIDFGSAKPLHNGKTEELNIWSLFSTEGFTAPEILECIRNNVDHITLFPSADIYSVGCLLYLLLTGRKIGHAAIDSNPNTPLSGKELRRLKKEGLPLHLESKLQSTLSKALTSKPQNRYQNVDEMLSDVRIITEALERRRDPIEAMEYDAFICYKHGTLDTAAALRLQKNLESYRSPKGISKKTHPFRNVFVDEGELASCPDMGVAINTALRNSKYLIVICSPDTPNSKWVDKEIKEFTELHGKDRILAVIISGNRDSSFPDRLKGDADAVGEVLAASAVGKTHRSVLRNLGGDALLKIASAMLDVPYDSLKQRKKAYVFRNIALISASAAILLSLFFVYAMYQAHLIKEQYLKTQISQARRMSDVSAELWKDGDKTGALVTALAVQSEDDPNEPVVPEQMYALNTALTSYKTGKWLSYNPAYTGAVQNISTACLSDDGRYLYVTDENNKAYVLSGDKGELLWEIDPDMIMASADPDKLPAFCEEFTEITHIVPYTEDECVVMLSHCVAVLKISSKSVERIIGTNPCITEGNSPIVAGGLLIIPENRYNNGSPGGIYIYNLNTGMLMDEILSTKNHPGRFIINDIALSSDGKYLAIGAGWLEPPDSRLFDSPLYSDNTKGEICGLIVYDIENKTERILSSKVTEKVFFGKDNRLIAVFSDFASDIEITNGPLGFTDYSYTLAIFDYSTGKNLYMSSEKESFETHPESSGLSLFLNSEKDNSVLAVWFGGELFLVDSASATVIFQYSFNDSITNVQTIDSNKFMVALNEGTVFSVSKENVYMINKILELTDIDKCIYNDSRNELIVIRDEKAIFCENTPDPTMTYIKSRDIFGEDDWVIKEKETIYYHINNKAYRFVSYIYKSNADYYAAGFAVFEPGSSDPIYVFKSKCENSSITYIGLGNKDNTTFLSFIENGEHQGEAKHTLYKVNLNSGKTVLTANMTGYASYYDDFMNNVVYSADMTALYVVCKGGAITKFDISGATVVPQNDAIMENGTSVFTDFKKDYLLILGPKGAPNVYDIRTKETWEIPLGNIFDETSESLNVVMGKSSTYACLFDKRGIKDHIVCIVDISKNEIISTIQTDSSDTIYDVDFFDNDKNLIITGKKTLSLYDTVSGTLLSNQKAPGITGCSIISDQTTPYFALKDDFIGVTVQSGVQTQPVFVFYVDQNHMIHTFADIDYGYFSPSDREILVRVPDGFCYGELKNYQGLKTSALQYLNGFTLTDEQKEKYYLTD